MFQSTWQRKLRKRIIYPEFLNLFDECCKCKRNNLLRAGYMLGWVLIAESIKTKIIESANRGEKAAEKAADSLKLLEDQKKSIDRSVIEASKELNFVSDTEYNTLFLLWEKRCIYAHPYNAYPTINEIDYLIAQAVDLTLSRPLTYRKPFIEALVADLLNTIHYLQNDETTIRTYARNVIERIEKGLEYSLFKSLLHALSQVINDPTKIKIFYRIRFFILELLERHKLSLHDASWSLEARAVSYPEVCILGLVDVSTWEFLPQRTQELLVEYFTTADETIYRPYSPFRLFLDVVENTFDQGFHDEIVRRIGTMSLDRSSNDKIPITVMFKKLYKELSSGDFYKIIPAIAYLRNVDDFSLIDNARLKALGMQLIRGASGNSWASQAYIREIISGLVTVPEDVKCGIAIGVFFYEIGRFALISSFQKEGALVANGLNQTSMEALKHAIDSFCADSNSSAINPHTTDEFFIKAEEWCNDDDVKLLLRSLKEQIYGAKPLA